MPRDGHQIAENPVILSDLLSLSAAALAPAEVLLDMARARVMDRVSVDGRVSGSALEAEQTAVHGLAWLATYVESLRQMQAWAERLTEQGKFGEIEQLIHQIAFGEYLAQITGGIQMNQAEILRPQDMGLAPEDLRGLSTPEGMALTQSGNTQAARMRLVALMRERRAEITVGNSGLDDELEMIREQFRRYALDRVVPHAHEWHLKDELIPM